jgi:hypothetical protein
MRPVRARHVAAGMSDRTMDRETAQANIDHILVSTPETVTIYNSSGHAVLTYTATIGASGKPEFVRPNNRGTLTGSAAFIACWQQQRQDGHMTLGDTIDPVRFWCACPGCFSFPTRHASSDGPALNAWDYCRVCPCEHRWIQESNLRRAAHIAVKQMAGLLEKRREAE